MHHLTGSFNASRPTIAFLDERNRSTGGIASINNDIEANGLASDCRVIRSGLRELPELLQRESQNGVPLVCIFDESCTWSRLPKLLLATAWRRMYWPRGLPCRFVLREHHYSESFVKHCVKSPWRFEQMLKLSYSTMDHVAAVSQGQFEWLTGRGLCLHHKLSVIKHAVGIEPLLAQEIRPPRRRLVFGAIGRFVRQKGFDLLLRAWAALPAKCNAHLVLAGYGDQEMELLARVCRMDRVSVLGPCGPADFYPQCDAVIIPSRYEPFGQVCLEARAAGKPVIASAVDGLPEQVVGCGYLYPPDDLDRLRDCIVDMCEIAATGRFSEMAANGRASARHERESYREHFGSWISEILT